MKAPQVSSLRSFRTRLFTILAAVIQSTLLSTMLDLKEGSPIDMLRQFAVHLDADFSEYLEAAKLVLNNDRGQGTITLYESYPGVTAWVYNINFKEDFLINFSFSKERPFYLGYIALGHQLQKFPEEKEFRLIRKGQNFVLISEPELRSDFLIPGGIDFECCYLILNPKLLSESPIPFRVQLSDNLLEMKGQQKGKAPYRHFGEIDLFAGRFADIIVNNHRTDFIGRLIIEGAVTNLLATQMEAHAISRGKLKRFSKLSNEELSKIYKLADYVLDNLRTDVTIPAICKALKISPKLLQNGVRSLYGCSVGRFVQNSRLELGKEMIHSTEMRLSEISSVIGITSKSYFSKLFKERFGILPGDYKKSFANTDVYFEISYRSMARMNLGDGDIKNIIDSARKFNSKHGITGCLVYHDGVFFQLIEGHKKSIIKLYEIIKRDKRHFDVTTIWQGVKLKRDFGSWDMAFIADNQKLNITYDGNSKELELSHLMENITENPILSKNFWEKVLSIIKTSK